MSKKKKIEIPSDWNEYLKIVQNEIFQQKINQQKEEPSEILLLLQELYQMFSLPTKLKYKKIKIDYHNSWKIEQIFGFVQDLNNQIQDSKDEDTKMVFSRVIFLHLSIFFRDYI